MRSRGFALEIAVGVRYLQVKRLEIKIKKAAPVSKNVGIGLHDHNHDVHITTNTSSEVFVIVMPAGVLCQEGFFCADRFQMIS